MLRLVHTHMRVGRSRAGAAVGLENDKTMRAGHDSSVIAMRDVCVSAVVEVLVTGAVVLIMFLG